MASSLLVLLDDITAVLDDVSALTQVAAKKTAVGNDAAVVGPISVGTTTRAHSARKAATGSSRAALRAGSTPASSPIATATASARMT